jgi:hypothetical protein
MLSGFGRSALEVMRLNEGWHSVQVGFTDGIGLVVVMSVSM